MPEPPRGLRIGQYCDGGDGDHPLIAARLLAPFTTTFVGCEEGVWTVELYAYGFDHVLDSVDITVGTPTLPTVGAPSITGTVQSTSIRLSWSSISGADKYRVRHRESGGGWNTPTETTDTEHTVSLTAYRTYDFQVQAHGDGTERASTWGAWSNTLVARTGPPPKPTRPTVQQVTTDSVTLVWPGIDGAATYQVEFRVSQHSTWTTLPEENVSGSGTITHTVSGLLPRTMYEFRARFRGDGARYVAWQGPWSPVVTGVTLGSAPAGMISIADLSGLTPQVGQNVSFTVDAFGLTPAERYKVTLTVLSGDFGFNQDCSDKDKELLDLNPGTGTSVQRQATIRACGASTASVIAHLLHDPPGGSQTTLHSHEVTVTASAPGPPTLEFSTSSPFVGQAVTLTASTPQSQGPVSSYQWQEWSAGSWSDLEGASNDATNSVSSDDAGFRIFRVVVEYTSGVTSESHPVSIEWRPITVTVAASPDFPQSGDPDTSTVTLTATADAPSDATYQWQQRASNRWVSLGVSSSSAQRDVSSYKRGTRKFRVVVMSHDDVSLAESAPIYVTWNEWAIVGDMIGELSTAVASSRDYRRAEAALLNCMNGGLGGKSRVPTPAPTYTSFDQILSMYVSTTKELMEDGGACAAPSSTMFNTNQRVARTELSSLKSGSAEYAGLLDTPHGRQFEANVGANHTIKQFSHLKAFQPSTVPSSGASRDTSLTGLDCLPSGGNEPTTLDAKLDVLNCLAFDTPYDFWINNAESLKVRIDSPNRWLGYGDWKCTPPAWQGPVPACLKHDVVFSSLQKFAGDNSGTEDSSSLDLAWNPRNKHLADSVFLVDIIEHGCQLESGYISEAICILDAIRMIEQAHLMHWAVNRMNSKGWPVTTHDVQHTVANQRYVACSVPQVSDVLVERDYGLFAQVFEVSWTYQSGCVSDITVNRYRICWDTTIIRLSDSVCKYPGGESTESSYSQPSILSFRSVKSLASIAIRPDEIEYGGALASLLLRERDDTVEAFKWLLELSPFPLTGIFYPEQRFDLPY